MTANSYEGWYREFRAFRTAIIDSGVVEIAFTDPTAPFSPKGIYLLLDNINLMVEASVGTTIAPTHESFSERGVQSQLDRLRRLMIESGYLAIDTSNDLNNPNYEGIFKQLTEITNMVLAGGGSGGGGSSSPAPDVAFLYEFPVNARLVDSSGNGNTLTNTGSVTFGPGHIGQEARFNGTNRLSAPNSPDNQFGDKDWCISVFWKPNNTFIGHMLSKVPDTVTNWEWGMSTNTNQRIQCFYGDGGTGSLGSVQTNESAYVANTVYFLMCIHEEDTNSVLWYQDNVLVAIDNNATPLGIGQLDFTMGQRSSNNQGLACDLCQPLKLNFVPTKAQRDALYNSGAGVLNPISTLAETTVTTTDPTDSDADAIITAINATGTTLVRHERLAITNHVIALKAVGLWDLLVAYYGFAGRTAAAHAVNWKNPGTFTIIWFAGMTHGITGSTSDGSGYGRVVGLSPSDLPQNNVTAGAWLRTHATSGGGFPCVLGATAASSNTQLYRNVGATNYEGSINSSPEVDGPANALGLVAITRSSADEDGVYNGGTLNTDLRTSQTPSALDFYIFARNVSDAAQLIGNYNLGSVFFMNSGLSEASLDALATAEAAYQVAMER